MNEESGSGRSRRPRISKPGDGPKYSRKPAGKPFDARDKYENGNLRDDKKPFRKNDSNSDRKPFNKFNDGDSDRKPFKKFDNNSDRKPFSRSYDSNSDRKPFNKFNDGESDRKPFKKFNDRDIDKNRAFVQKRRLEKIEKDIHKDTIRLNKYIANSGICSRREADDLIKQGLVEVNGKVVTEMGYQVQKSDRVVFDGQGITPEKNVYVLLNKPKGYISTTKDEKARKTVMDLVANASPYRVFPVGRLDRSTTGVILLTNDGHLTKKLTHPSFNVKKIYHVTLDRKLSAEDMQAIADGIRLEEGVAQIDAISYIEGKPKNEVGIELHIGWNRVIRRIFQRLGYEVEGLDRVTFAGLTKKNIKRGHWRILTELEVNNLKML